MSGPQYLLSLSQCSVSRNECVYVVAMHRVPENPDSIPATVVRPTNLLVTGGWNTDGFLNDRKCQYT